MMEIRDIRATDNASQARYCVPNNSDVCWRLWHEGDLSDYENGDYVNIDISELRVVGITSVWFTSKWGYWISRVFIGHRAGTFFGKFIFTPLVFFFLIVGAIGLFTGEGSEEDEEGLEFAGLVIWAEKEFGLEIADEDAIELESVGELCQYIVNAVNSRGDVATYDEVFRKISEYLQAEFGVQTSKINNDTRFSEDLGIA